MTNPIAPSTIATLPSAPLPNDTPASFDSKAFALLSAQVAMVSEFNTSASQTYQNAVAANERAVSASGSATAAAGSASAASLDATRLAALDALWLGAAAADPTTGRGGAALVAGNAYVNTVSGVVRAYNGSGWVQGVGATAGVASLNGAAGALVRTTLAAYGITDMATGAQAGANMNALITSGIYSFSAATNGPTGVSTGVLFVARQGGDLGQVVVGADGSIFSRGATGIGGSPVFSPWRRAAQHNDVAVPLAGGAIDCAAGNRFTETVSANRTLAFSNIPASGSYACVLEINHTGGAITMPAGTVWKGVAPTLVTGARHLIYFECARLGTAGWYASALDGYPA